MKILCLVNGVPTISCLMPKSDQIVNSALLIPLKLNPDPDIGTRPDRSLGVRPTMSLGDPGDAWSRYIEHVVAHEEIVRRLASRIGEATREPKESDHRHSRRGTKLSTVPVLDEIGVN